MKSGFFILNGHSSQDQGIFLTDPPAEVFAERDVSFLNIPGRSGELLVDNGRYKNTNIQYKCAIAPRRGETLREAVTSAMGFLNQFVGYVRVEDTFNPDYYRMAAVTASNTVESIMERAGRFSLQLNCKPQRWLKSGEREILLSAPGELRNPTTMAALPMITVYGEGAGVLSVGGKSVEILSMEGNLVLDCSLQQAYSDTQYANGSIYAPEFPVLFPGMNEISWEGGITAVSIRPRWWVR